MGKISFEHEHLDHYSGQDNYELGIYDNDDIVGYVDYTIYNNELTISDILVKPSRRREGFGSMLVKKMKDLHPEATYIPSYKTELGSKFVHKDVDITEARRNPETNNENKIITKDNLIQLIESTISNKPNFKVYNNKFKLFINNTPVSESMFNVEPPDEFFNENYISIYDLKTNEQYQGKGFAKLLLDHIFNYAKNNLNINVITLIVDKNNPKAVNLYKKMGFEVFMEYDESFSLIKKL